MSSVECGGRIPETAERATAWKARGLSDLVREDFESRGTGGPFVTGSVAKCLTGTYRRCTAGGRMIPFSTAHAASCVRDVNPELPERARHVTSTVRSPIPSSRAMRPVRLPLRDQLRHIALALREPA